MFRVIVQYRAIFFDECLFRYFHDSFGGDGTIFLHFVVDVFRFSDEFEESQVGGYIQVIDVAENLFAFVTVLYLFQFGFVDAFGLHGFQFLPNGSFGFFQRNSRCRLASDLNQTIVNAS